MKKCFVLFLASFILLNSCRKTDISNIAEYGLTSAKKTIAYPPELPPEDASVPGATISWDDDDVKISHNVYNAEYPRVHRVNDTTLLLTYHFGNASTLWKKIAIRRSMDNGVTWEAPIIIAPPSTGYYGYSNPDILVLRNGWAVLAYVGRGNPDDNAHSNVQLRLSKNAGVSWSAPIIVATGRSWEPAMVQLPSGEIDVFYSSEAAWWMGPGSSSPQNQNILMVSSCDGVSWSAPLEVAHVNNTRDGMPVPVLLAENKGIVFSIESVFNSESPWLVWSSTTANFHYSDGVGTVANQRRWAASNTTWDGGSYLIQLPNDLTVLSGHTESGRNTGGNWKKSTMVVRLGNSVAKNFTNLSYPWPDLASNEGAFFNSLFVKNDSTIMAIATRNYPDGHNEIHWKTGHLQLTP